MINMRRSIVLFIVACGICCDIAHARQIDFELRLEKNRTVPGRQTYVKMVFKDTPDIPVPDAPLIKGLNIAYLKQETEKVRTQDRLADAVVHVYKVVGLKPGSFTIGPVVFGYKGDTYRSNSVVLEVEKSLSPSQIEAALPEKAAVDISGHIYLILEVPKTTVYVNERVPVTLNFYSDWFSLDSMAGGEIKGDDLIVDDLRTQESKVVPKDDKRYMLIQQLASLTAPTAGQFTIKPVTVSVDVVKYDENDFRSRLNMLNDNAGFYDQFIGPSKKRTVELRTDPVSITVLPLPKKGQPEGFAGAVGDFSFGYSASASEAMLGEEVTLKMSIKGPGNYSTVSVPLVKKADGIKWYEPRAIKGDNSVIYEQVILIQSPDLAEIPEAVFTFFSPAAGKYVSLTKGPFPIRVAGVSPGAAMMAKKALDAEARKDWVDGLKDASPLSERDAPFYRKRSFLMFETTPILAVIAAVILYGIMRYLRAHPLYAASFVAASRAKREIAKAGSMIGGDRPLEFYDHVFRILQEYLGTRRLKPSEGITSRIIDEIDTAGIERDVIDRIREVFYECYIARYTREGFGKDDMKKTLDALAYVVDNLNRKAEL